MLAAVTVTACGSSGSSSSSSSTPATSTASSATSANTVSAGPFTAQLDKEYAPGVATLKKLYEEGSESPPPAKSPPIAKSKFIWWVSCGQAAPGCAGPPNAAKEAAKALGWKYQICDGKLNPKGWADCITQGIAAKPDAIITHGLNCGEVDQPLKTARAAGINVLMLEGIDCGNPGFAGAPLSNVDFVYSPSIKNGYEYFKQWGITQSSYVVDQSEGKAQIIRSDFQGGLGKVLTVGDKEVLSKCPGCQVHDLTWASGGQVNGTLKQSFNTMMLKYPKADAFIADFDTNTITVGLSKAIDAAGRAKRMIVVSGEGYAPVQTVISQDGGANAAPAHDGHWMAWAALDRLNRFFNHSPAVPEGIGFRIVDKTHNLTPGKDYASPIAWRPVYEKAWKAAGAPG